MIESVADLADLEGGWNRTHHWLSKGARRALFGKLQGLRGDRLRVIEQWGDRPRTEHHFGDAEASGAGLDLTLWVRDRRFYARVLFGGTIGAGEAYMADWWRCDDLTGLVRLLVRQRHIMDGMEGGWARLGQPLRHLFHRLRRNTRRGSRRNIEAHYDLSNEFFQLMLDRRMMYSCAVYERPDMDLDEASTAKLDRICRKLDLKPGDHLLEIGTGWGGMALYAAQHFGCRVTTTTISPSQAAYARRRVEQAGLQDRVQILTQDYRDLEGSYDKLVSIEMIEAVGLDHLDTYFACCNRLLAPDGVMLLQAITIDDRLYESARHSVDFIQRYIFPGSGIPALGPMTDALKRVTGLTPIHLEDIGLHYATTLRDWRQRFFDRLDSVRALGFSKRFERMWEFYLCYCEGGFLERSISDIQLLLAGPQYRGAAPLGQLTGRDGER